jgi:FKBP-type peptidyl-prolyl cis-trans isomerase
MLCLCAVCIRKGSATKAENLRRRHDDEGKNATRSNRNVKDTTTMEHNNKITTTTTTTTTLQYYYARTERLATAKNDNGALICIYYTGDTSGGRCTIIGLY